MSTAESTSETKPQLPRSVTHFGLNSITLVILLGALYALRNKTFPVRDPVMFLAMIVAVPTIVLDVMVLGVHKRATTGMDWDKPFTVSLGRVATKLLGLVLTLAPFALAYWMFPEYQGSFYDPFYNLFRHFWPGLIASTLLYFTYCDGYARDPEDVYWQLGRLALGKRGDARGKDIANHYRGWLVKAFFFPLMFVWLNNSTHNVVNFRLQTGNFHSVYQFAYDFIFFVDLVYATVGYATCFKPIDTHIRTAEPTFLGWGVALFCYEPFFSGLFERQYVKYGGNQFGDWLAPYPTLRWVWAGAIVALITIYVLGTVAFGVRFSNLTHRGVLTNGPYRWTKHPAYVSKNASWWLASVPFVVSDGVAHAIQRSLLLFGVNFMYFMRARTEERHLSHDPTYVQYALWMNEHGVLRFLNRIPIFRYRSPEQGGDMILNYFGARLPAFRSQEDKAPPQPQEAPPAAQTSPSGS